jgi:hypothetical protein
MSFMESKFNRKKLYLNGYFYIRDRISDTYYNLLEVRTLEHYAKKCKRRVIDTGNEVKEKG